MAGHSQHCLFSGNCLPVFALRLLDGATLAVLNVKPDARTVVENS